MFSQTVEYSLRAMVCLATAAPESRTTDQIAEATKVPTAYLSKVLQNLRHAGLVESRRGIGGGMILAREAEDITVLEIIGAVDPIRRIEKCPLGLPEHIRLCPLHARLDAAIAEVESAFRDTTLAEVIPGRKQRATVCRFPAE